MNDDQLKKLWQQQPLREPAPAVAQLILAAQRQTTQLRRTLAARDLRELAACFLVIIVFGIFYFTVYREPLSRLGDLIVIGSTIFIAWKLVHTRRATPPAPPGAMVIESLRAELNTVRAQSHLLGTVLWWYLLPGFVGLVMATWGLRVDPYSKIACTLFFLAVDGFIYWLNQWARSKQLLPLEAQLQSLLHSAESGEPLDLTHLAALRPIVLSMAAADRVKPVEFKVAFWQIALYGEIGFLGIWFFLMLGLSLDYEAGKTLEQPAVTISQTVRAEETNRYAVAVRKVVARLNTGDWAAVAAMYNAEMTESFPPEETTGFYSRLVAQFGVIENWDGPAGNGYRGWMAYRLYAQHGELTMSVALDADDKISGIYFQPTPRPSPNITSLLARVFHWPHLAWIAPFFLAGLWFSRVLQRMTERAVGISSLGVHLQKGQILILWEDIKEVQPLRMLNIRSLWLVRESGEKTILPWTSLERHDELKAAVEDFAPASHPMRKYLGLLARLQPK